jgi:hypothetical protein
MQRRPDRTTPDLQTVATSPPIPEPRPVPEPIPDPTPSPKPPAPSPSPYPEPPTALGAVSGNVHSHAVGFGDRIDTRVNPSPGVAPATTGAGRQRVRGGAELKR